MDRRELQIAWAAGFLDGEGCFNLSKNSGRGCHETTKNAVIHASQIRKAPLERLAELFGGNVNVMRVNDKGQVIYQWCLTGSQLVPIIEELLPYLVGKQEEAQAVLDYCKTIGARRGKPVSRWTVVQRRAIIARHTSARGR
jgi:hypothetical protein